jgi:hypothetical protein
LDLFKRDTCGIQTINAARANSAHMTSEPLHPNPASCANGTLVPAARDAPTAIKLEYRLVIRPELLSKFRFVRLGNSTLPKAMAIPNNKVPK